LKKILLIIIFLFLCKSKIIKAFNYEFEWFNSTVEIPVKESIHDYKEKPYCHVYANGVLQSYQLYYERGVNFTTLTTVQTNRVGEYKVYYRVSFRDLNNVKYTHTKMINFYVKDFEAPKVEINEAIKVSIDKINLIDDQFLKKGLKITDNYSRPENIRIEVDRKSIKLKIGIHQVSFTATDEAENVTAFERTLIIFDDIPPELVIISEHLKLSVGGSYDLFNNVIVSDNSGERPEVTIFPEIDFNKIGLFEVTYQAVDASGNTIKSSGQIEIIDDILPKLELKMNEVQYTTNEYHTLNFVSYILEASDNYDLLSEKDVLIDLSEYDKGSLKEEFKVTYSLTDLSGNTKTVIVKFSLSGKISPQIIFTDTTILVGAYFDPKKDVKAICSLGRDLTDRIIVSSNSVNVNKIGTYSISYYVYDDFGNTITKNRSIVVTNEEKNNQFKTIITLFQEQLLIIIALFVIIAAFIYFKYRKKKV